MIRAIIFDLDTCLGSPDELGREHCEPAFDAIRRASNGHLTGEALEAALEDCWWHSLDVVAARHGFSDAMINAGWRAFGSLRAPASMVGYGDLPILFELPRPLFLVTTGFRVLQDSKIDALGIRTAFEEIFVDAIDDPGRTGKRAIFETIARKHDWPNAEVLVVGDNPDSEIAAGIRLGMRTVQILRPHVGRDPSARYHVRDLAELRALLDSLRSESMRG